MDDRHFDALVRGLASGQNRRAFVKGLLGLGAGALTGAAVTESTDAARRPTPTPSPVRCPGIQTWNGTKCACPTGTNCGPDCCAGDSVCCDNACCHGQCYGEELCCPTGQVVCEGVCCPTGQVCFEGECQSCTLCGDDCCSLGTEQCCQNGETFTCASAAATCCTEDSVCFELNFCDGNTAHRFNCTGSVCTETVLSCAGDNPCSTYRCDQGFCFEDHIAGCCTDASACHEVDTCTPAACLDNHTCNAVSSCGSGVECCSGTCSWNGAQCCGIDADCPAPSCSDLGSEAYKYTCVDHMCSRQTTNCLGSNQCMSYGCSAGICTQSPISSCCIEGVVFPPCVEGCNTCVAPDGGTLCGCAVTTTQTCNSSAICKELFDGESICAGPPGSSICIRPSGPLN